MKILFLLKNTGMHERIGIMTLSSILKQHGHIVQLILTGELHEEECIIKVKEFEPHILAYSIMTGEHNYHIDLNQMIRSHYSCFSVFGGPHPTFKPDMIEKHNVDAQLQAQSRTRDGDGLCASTVPHLFRGFSLVLNCDFHSNA